MALAGEPDRNRCLAYLARGFFFADVTFQSGAELRTPARYHETDDFTLERAPDFEYLPGLIQRRLRSGCRSPWRRIDQAFGLQLAESGAHQCAAHAEASAEFVFGKFRAGRQRLLDDRLAQYPAGNIDAGRFLAHAKIRNSSRRRPNCAYNNSGFRTRDEAILIDALQYA